MRAASALGVPSINLWTLMQDVRAFAPTPILSVAVQVAFARPCKAYVLYPRTCGTQPCGVWCVVCGARAPTSCFSVC